MDNYELTSLIAVSISLLKSRPVLNLLNAKLSGNNEDQRLIQRRESDCCPKVVGF